jgi:hypothetical protein
VHIREAIGKRWIAASGEPVSDTGVALYKRGTAPRNPSFETLDLLGGQSSTVDAVGTAGPLGVYERA